MLNTDLCRMWTDYICSSVRNDNEMNKVYGMCFFSFSNVRKIEMVCEPRAASIQPTIHPNMNAKGLKRWKITNRHKPNCRKRRMPRAVIVVESTLKVNCSRFIVLYRNFSGQRVVRSDWRRVFVKCYSIMASSFIRPNVHIAMGTNEGREKSEKHQQQQQKRWICACSCTLQPGKDSAHTHTQSRATVHLPNNDIGHY